MSKGNVLCACCAVVALMVSAATVEAGQPSASKMRQMGLYGANVVSDSVAMEVRGFGFFGNGNDNGKSHASVWGKSSVEFEKHGIEAEAENAYSASGPNGAAGKSFSFAGIVKVETGHDGKLHIKAKLGVAGGFAAASAH